MSAAPHLCNPLAGEITSGWDLDRLHPLHRRPIPHYGTDVGGRPRGGRHTIHAPADGVVIAARDDSYPGDARPQGRYLLRLSGNHAVIEHEPVNGQTFRTYLGHLDDVYVTAGQRVTAGQVIGTQGATGEVDGAHLHLEVWLNGQPVDPARFFAAHGVKLGSSPTTPKETDVPLTATEWTKLDTIVNDRTDEAAEACHGSVRRDLPLDTWRYRNKNADRDAYGYLRRIDSNTLAIRATVESFTAALAAVAGGASFDKAAQAELVDAIEARFVDLVGESLNVSVTIEGAEDRG